MALFKKHAGAGTIDILGQPLSCQFCGHAEFVQREGKIQTTGMTLMDLDWLNRSATAWCAPAAASFIRKGFG